MLVTMLQCKLHRATVTHVDLHYEGSLGIDRALVEMAGLLPGQQIDVLNISNGVRFTTYVLEEDHGSRRIGIYGAAAHLASPGDRIIVLAYAHMEQAEARRHSPIVLVLDEQNEIASNG